MASLVAERSRLHCPAGLPKVQRLSKLPAGVGPGFTFAGQCCDLRRLRDPEAISYCNGWQGFQGAIRWARVGDARVA